MSSSPVLDAANLPDTALPFVRELVLEIVRRVPANLGTPPRFAAEDLGDALRCADSARSLVQWFDTVPDALVERMDMLETVFGALLDLAQVLDNRVRRAVLQVRGHTEEESTFVRSLSEVLCDVRDSIEVDGEAARATEMLSEVLRRIEARERGGDQARQALSSHFHRIQGDLDSLREEIATVEQQTRALREQSQRDPLTGLSNRLGYEIRLAEEVARALRYDFPLSVAVWDIDQLSAINARYGHPCGDLVLQSLAGRALGMLRRSDFLARTEGEEFAVIFTSTPGAQAKLAAEKIRRLVAKTPVDTAAGTIAVTASIGVAELRPGDTPADLHHRAIQLLSRAQRRSASTALQQVGTTTH